MITVAEAARPLPASSGKVLRTAQLIRLADVLSAARVPGPLRQAAVRVLRSRLDRGLFGMLMALGCSVTDSEPMRSLTLSRPLTGGRRPLWASGRPGTALLIRLTVHEHGDSAEVRVAVGVGGLRSVRGLLAWLVLRGGRPLARWCLSAWLTSLEDRVRSGV